MQYKMVEIPVYKMHFGPNGPVPLSETQLIFQEDITLFFQSKEHLREDIIKNAKGYGATKYNTSLRENTGKVGKDETVDQTIRTNDFNITYENPITNETETLNVSTQAIITDIENPIDATIAGGSTYPIYKYIASPLFSTLIYKEFIDEQVLENIRKRIEVVSPGPYGAGSVIPINEILEKENEIREIKKIEKAKDNLIESVKRGKIMAGQIDEKIELLEYLINELEEGKSLAEILKKVPENIRTLILIQLSKRKKVNNKMIIELLKENILFLKELKGKLVKMEIPDLVGIAKSIKKISKKDKK